MGVGITGRMNKFTGESYTYFTFLNTSLREHLTNMLGMPVFIDNDTRCYGLIENTLGRAKNKQNAIIINLSRGFGSSLIVNNTLVTGGMGFAGEIGHMQFGESDKMCICGKTGCIGNEIGGFALEERFKAAIENGENSLLGKQVKNIRYDDILDIALKGDALSIRLLQEMGHQLGKALGNLINLLNPEIIIIGGKFAKAEVIIGNSIRSGMMSTALVNSLRFCELVFSELGETSGIKGAGGLVYEYYGLI
jgi:predicted NBD/HSP70 family sugar kinase